MFSLNLQTALERELVGQPRAVHTVVRAVAVALGGLGNPDGPVGVYLLVGPNGTGKTELARSLARQVHGTTERLVVVDCGQLGSRHELETLTRQVATHFRHPYPMPAGQMLGMAPLSILLVEHVERARPEFIQGLLAAFGTGYLVLPDGSRGSLRGSLVLLTSNLCSREIHDAGKQEIGFSHRGGDLEESEKARVYQLCVSAAERLWGSDLLGRLDDLIVFHRLSESHLHMILRRMVSELNRQLAPHGMSCELQPEAEEFLLDRGSRFPRHGAWVLVRVFRRFVVFPLADLAQTGCLVPGSRVRVERESPQRLCLSVAPGLHSRAIPRAVDVPVLWSDPVS